MLSIYKNFKKYVKYGIVPGIKKNGHLVPQNSFYKSVHYIDSVIGSVKDTVFGAK
ncbi:MAG: hypothetical protein PG981_000392 [Wolbachia endosymbiont of Ctenocephalides orientis wCori]|nr:MAG: hypothetical protein PG981_000392 [Wolbachia endosymbiont of Ctenocephalides orientis wCori]